MPRLPLVALLLLPAVAPAADPPKPTVIATGLKDPDCIAVTPDGRTFVGTADGVVEVKEGKAKAFADLKGPTAMVPFQGWLFVLAQNSVHRVELATGKAEVWADKDDFTERHGFFTGITADEKGSLYVSDAGIDVGKPKGSQGAVHSVGVKPGRPGKPPTRGEIQKVADVNWTKIIEQPRAVLTDGLNHVYVLGQNGDLARVRPRASGGGGTVAAEGLKGGNSLCADQHGRVFVFADEAIWGIPRPGEKPVKVRALPQGMSSVGYHPLTRQLLIGDQVSGSLLAAPAVIPGWEVDESPMPVGVEPAFANVDWTGWDDGSGSGKTNTFRPIVLTHANDASGRTFVATQHGVIHAIDKGAKASKVFLDLQAKVFYSDKENEQGLLGLAFHPKHKTTGECFVFYTDKTKRFENVLSRFRVKKDDPSQADPASEEELLRVSHKYWNHDGGTVAFGPDGFLYLVLGDGGDANDPDDHGQKGGTLLGKILRIDINAKGDGTPYAIPKDNPFADGKAARPEVYALGVRNPWRLSFDKKTGQGWFGDVGQNLWEEIDLLAKGANYGWRRREGLHPFGADGSGPDAKYTDPIWEYHHDVGKSITAGHVYRGSSVPALDGHFLYADYVSGKLWALKYDDKMKRVTANRLIASKQPPVLSFGEDEAGEVYYMTYTTTGKGIFKFKAK